MHRSLPSGEQIQSTAACRHKAGMCTFRLVDEFHAKSSPTRLGHLQMSAYEQVGYTAARQHSFGICTCLQVSEFDSQELASAAWFICTCPADE